MSVYIPETVPPSDHPEIGEPWVVRPEVSFISHELLIRACFAGTSGCVPDIRSLAVVNTVDLSIDLLEFQKEQVEAGTIHEERIVFPGLERHLMAVREDSEHAVPFEGIEPSVRRSPCTPWPSGSCRHPPWMVRLAMACRLRIS